MIPKAAMEKAIEGGWKFKGHFCLLELRNDGQWLMSTASQDEIRRINDEEIALDPLFWGALGKSLEWSEEWQHLTPYGYKYLDVAHEFVNFLLTGGNTDKYWQQLLKEN